MRKPLIVYALEGLTGSPQGSAGIDNTLTTPLEHWKKKKLKRTLGSTRVDVTKDMKKLNVKVKEP